MLRYSFLLLIACFTIAHAQTASVQLLTDAELPTDFGTFYPLGPTSNEGYTYGPSFIIGTNYELPTASTLSLHLFGAQEHYHLAWTVQGSGVNHPMEDPLGASVLGVSGAQTEVYYNNSGTLQELPSQATRYKIGVRATPAAAVDLYTQVTLTLTIN